MILIQFCRFSSVVDARDWFLHFWNPPVIQGVAYPARMTISLCNDEEFSECAAIRLFGLEVAILKTCKPIAGRAPSHRDPPKESEA